jgi:hypothetical protein
MAAGTKVQAEETVPASDSKDTREVIDRSGAVGPLALDKKMNKKTKGYEIRNHTGERVYFSRDSADAEARLDELAAQNQGTGLTPLKQPGITLSEVSFIESVGFEPDETDGDDSQARVTGPVK